MSFMRHHALRTTPPSCDSGRKTLNFGVTMPAHEISPAMRSDISEWLKQKAIVFSASMFV